jgi:hypothetical protein
MRCNDTIYGYNFLQSEDRYEYHEYGKGLGRTYFERAGENTEYVIQFYFSKEGRECGMKNVLGIEYFRDQE